MKFRGGGATRKTAPACDLTLCYLEDKDNLSPNTLKKTCLEEFYEKMICHSGSYPESINVDKNRLRLGGRSDESGKIIHSFFRHSELDSESLNTSTDSGSEAGMTGIESNILPSKVWSDEGSRTPCTPSRHSDESQSLTMPIIGHKWQQKHRKAAFTLAEVLITLGIIGIVAAMTLPTLIGKYKEKVRMEQFKVAYSLLQQMVLKVQADWGYCPECYYWLKNPYGSAKCATYDSNGGCLKWTLSDGSPLPSNYNGNFGDCEILLEEISKQFQVIQVCEGNAYKKGCIADYEGIDTIKQQNNENMTDEEAFSQTRGCSAFRKQNIQNNLTAYVLKNGIIIIPYSSNGYPIWLIDINGKRGPNKWGHDLFVLRINGLPNTNLQLSTGGCEATEKGGKTTAQMIKDMYAPKVK